MLPVIAIVGRPNVGKSTLFNCLTRTRNALVSAYPGTTRDRQYGKVDRDGHSFILIDTGGITEEANEIGKLITQQALQAIEDADKIIFLVDAQSGITDEDKMIADVLRRSRKPVYLTVNKTEGLDPDMSVNDAYELGMESPIAIAAAHGRGIADLIEKLFPQTAESENMAEENRYKTN